MNDHVDNTTWHIGRWQEGRDGEALERLLSRHMGRIREMVEARLGATMRGKLEAGDIVQEALLEFVRYGPPFRLENGAQFRSLLARIVRNVICDQYERMRALRRDMKREAVENGLDDSVIDLDRYSASVTNPGDGAAKREERRLLHLALELLEPRSRAVLIARQIDGESFESIATKLDFPTPEAARAFRNRARKALRQLTVRLASGAIAEIVEDRRTNPKS